VLALKESHSWWHREGTIGALWEAAEAAGWKDADDPGRWRKVMRAFRDGHEEEWNTVPKSPDVSATLTAAHKQSRVLAAGRRTGTQRKPEG
jgi:hypothetical protein